MKNIKKIISLAIVFSLCLSVFGCSVNEEKLATQAVAKVGDEKVLKKDLDDVVGFTLVSYYASSGQNIDLKDSSVSNLKEEVVNNLIEVKLAEKASKEYGYTLDEKEVNTQVTSTLKSIKSSSYLKGENYLKVLNQYGFKDDAAFQGALKKYARMSVYLGGFVDKFRTKVQGKEYATNTYMTVGDIKVPASIYYYCLIQKAMEQEYNDYNNSYNNTGTDQTEKTEEQKKQELEASAAEMTKEKAAFYAAGAEKKIKVTNKQITSQRAQNESLDSMFGSDTMTSIYNAYGITKAQYDSAGKWIATADLYKAQMEKGVTYDKPTDKDAESEFKKNTDTYDKSTVSAKHVLTKDKNLAKEIYDAATAKGANFDQIMSKYQSNESVEEAKDLGAFTYATMVKEFSKAAFDAEKGSVVGPVKTEYGYHVIYVYDKKIEEPKFEDYKETILYSLDSERKTEATEKISTDTVKKYSGKVEIKDIEEPYNMFIASEKDKNKVKIYKSVLNK